MRHFRPEWGAELLHSFPLMAQIFFDNLSIFERQVKLESFSLLSRHCDPPARRRDRHHQQAAHGNVDGPAEQQGGHLQVHLRGRAERRRGEAQKAREEEEEGPTTQTHISGGAAGAHQPQGRSAGVPDLLLYCMRSVQKALDLQHQVTVKSSAADLPATILSVV